ncbi:hypothetical protein M378DRAFT_672165 [Amanita muscaria Koide BX008]|uniref:Uncharacterized protein n=1 Tax=Amanita muscaria (strain Koide BX008) TaxID=946122 RepID=A0A0C2X3Z7_AMAMK|nr:hypothetical protein M378DRAFT_672165 [Amanita muscaria Koide BX008]
MQQVPFPGHIAPNIIAYGFERIWIRLIAAAQRITILLPPVPNEKQKQAKLAPAPKKEVYSIPNCTAPQLLIHCRDVQQILNVVQLKNLSSDLQNWRTYFTLSSKLTNSAFHCRAPASRHGPRFLVQLSTNTSHLRAFPVDQAQGICRHVGTSLIHVINPWISTDKHLGIFLLFGSP